MPEPVMQPYYQYVMDFLNSASGDAWAWFAGLTREEWLIVLAAVTALGFLCMRGYGSRNGY